MLKILVLGIDEIPADAIMDAEKAFAMSKLDGGEIDRKLITEVEKGEYLNPESFIDRFGYKLWRSCLSTGCKAALAIHHNSDTPISCIEAGVNALSAVVKYCKQGVIIVPNMELRFNTLGAEEIDVLYRGYRFTSISRFSSYMKNEWPDMPEVGVGVELCTS